MCGICGEFNFGQGRGASLDRLLTMAAKIQHRGPNDGGEFVSGPCGLGFRRLSIIDLDGGHQPIANEDETIWVTLNGEIYNYPELRRDLEARGHRFRSHSDTEVIVHLYEEHGLDFCRHLRGMFGICLYDVKNARMVLVRDRLGIKPVYYWKDSERLVYASEIKAILAHPAVSAEPDEASIFEFLWLRSSLTPGTLFKNIRKLPAGSMIVATATGCQVSEWWRLSLPAERINDLKEAVPRYESALAETVHGHLLSDVPVGLFLSGGLDSSVLASIVQEQTNSPVKCFTAGFAGDKDESHWAAQVAKHIGAEHEILRILPPEPEILEEIVWHLDEPIADPACLPTYLLSQEAAKHVRVVLTGEGSDETNLGYAKLLRFLLFDSKPMLFGGAKLFWPLLRRTSFGRSRMENYHPLWSQAPGLARIIANDGFNIQPTDASPEALSPKLGVHRAQAIAKLQGRIDQCSSNQPVEKLLHFGLNVFLQEGLLMKMDKMTMAHGLEGRVPFLDHQLVELAAAMTPAVRLAGGRTKAVLRAIAEKRLPANIAGRKQHGFLVPLDQWFGGSFADFASSLLSPAILQKREMFDPNAVAGVLAAYRDSGKHARLIWSLVLLELWYRRFID